MRLSAAPRLCLLLILVGIAVMVAAFALYANARIQFQMSVPNADGGGRRIGPVIRRRNDPDPSTTGHLASET